MEASVPRMPLKPSNEASADSGVVDPVGCEPNFVESPPKSPRVSCMDLFEVIRYRHRVFSLVTSGQDFDEFIQDLRIDHPRTYSKIKAKIEFNQPSSVEDRDLAGVVRSGILRDTFDPSELFPDVPAPLTHCGLTEALGCIDQASGPNHQDQIGSVGLKTFLETERHRLRVRTGRKLLAIFGTSNPAVFFAEPTFESVDRHRVSLPAEPSHWTIESGLRSKLSDSLSQAMEFNQKPPIQPSITLGAVEGETAPDMATPAEEKTASKEEKTSPCDAQDILRRADAAILRQPITPDDLYTFPSYLAGENPIYKDYVVTIPIDCENCPTEERFLGRRTTAAKMLAARGHALIRSIEDSGFLSAFGRLSSGGSYCFGGRAVLRAVDELLCCVARVDNSTPRENVASLQERLKEVAGVLRLVVRTDLYSVDLGLGEAIDQVRERNDALGEQYEIGEARLPRNSMQTNNPSSPVLDLANDTVPDASLLRFPLATSQEVLDLMFEAFGEGGVRAMVGALTGGIGALAPNAVLEGALSPLVDPLAALQDLILNAAGFAEGHQYTTATQWNDLRRYLIALGTQLGPELNQLREATSRLIDELDAAGNPESALEATLSPVLSGIQYRIAEQLSMILEEAAANLDRVSSRRAGGSKRLGLQLIYRQWWRPTGYAKGNLVGYKTLLPAQRESLTRRSLVRTRTETSRTDEFRAAREASTTDTDRETREILAESADKFGFSSSVSGGVDFEVWNINGSVGANGDFSSVSRDVRTRLSESVAKAATTYNERRESRITEFLETEDETTLVTEIANPNVEITANYFYYQLLREYEVDSELTDVRPVLLMTRSLPSAAEIDDRFISRHMHVLLDRLPAQLAADAEESVDAVREAQRAVIRARAELDRFRAHLELAESREPDPGDVVAHTAWLTEIQKLQGAEAVAKSGLVQSQSEEEQLRIRIDRGVKHVREHICSYMHSIWSDVSIDGRNKELEGETFCSASLDSVTGGYQRLGFSGADEVFRFTGRSQTLMELLLRLMIPGTELGTDKDLVGSRLVARLRLYHPDRTDEEIRDFVRSFAFVKDPGEGLLDGRRIQVAQDALVVETMPGMIPLLEGFQMAHRMLDVEQQCLENRHLAARIQDRPWKSEGSDDYVVRRSEGIGVDGDSDAS